MATIYKRKTGEGETRYRAIVTAKGHPRVSRTFSTKRAAEKWAATQEREIDEGTFSPEARRRTVGELIERYKAHRRASRAGGGGDRNRLRQLDWWAERVGRYALAALTPAVLAEVRDGLLSGDGRARRPAAPATVHRYFSALSVALAYGVEIGWLKFVPTRGIRKPRVQNERVRYLDRERELPALLAACREAADRRLYPLVVLALSTGARQGELLSLRWSEIDGERGVAVLPVTKNGEARGLALSRPALDALAELRRVRSLGSRYVFGTPRAGEAPPKFSGTLRKSWYAALRASGVANFRFHDLRHTVGSYLAMSGATTHESAGVLGHKTLAMVKRYAHLAPDHVRGVVERMADNFLTDALDGGAK